MRIFSLGTAGFSLILFLTLPLCAETRPNFSGIWNRDGAHSVPPRSAAVTLHITHRDPELTVETTILPTPSEKQHAIQRYSTDGRESVTTGADGDTFRTKIVWHDKELVFTIVENEKGSTIYSTEIWSLSDDGNTLKLVRRSPEFKGEHLVLYKRAANRCLGSFQSCQN